MMKTLRVLFVALFALLFGQQISAQVEVFNETFDNFDGKGGNDGFFDAKKPNTDVANEVITGQNANFDNDGWTYEKAFSANQCIKLGSSSQKGSATTPALTKLNGNATLTFKAAAWNTTNEKTTLNVTINGGGSLDQESVTLKKGEFTTYTINITGGTSASTITFEAKEDKSNRFFLDDVKIESNGSTSTKKDAGLKFSETSIEIEKGQTFTAPTFTKATSADVTFSSDNVKVATVDAAGVISLAGGEGTAVITAKAEANEEYDAGEAKCTITVSSNSSSESYNVYKKADAVVSGHKYLLVAQRDDKTYYGTPLSKKNKDKGYGYMSTFNKDGLQDEIKIETKYNDDFTFIANGDGYDIVDHDGYYYYHNTTYATFQVSQDAPSTHWTVTPNGDGTFRIEMNGYYMQFGQGTYTSFGVYTDAQDNTVQPMLYELVSEPAALADITIDGGYATAYRDAAFTVPEGLTAGIVTKVNNDNTLKIDYRYAAGTVVPAKTPVLVKGNDGTYTLAAAESTETAPEGNLLHGADAVKDGKTYVDGDVVYYILSKSKDGSKLGFYWGADNGAAVNYVDGKAFLAIDAASGAKLSEGFSLEGDVTGIESVETKALKNANAVYTIAGVRLNKKVNELTKGLYIVNGKKVIVK